jgi:hypothetical protein
MVVLSATLGVFVLLSLLALWRSLVQWRRYRQLTRRWALSDMPAAALLEKSDVPGWPRDFPHPADWQHLRPHDIAAMPERRRELACAALEDLHRVARCQAYARLAYARADFRALWGETLLVLGGAAAGALIPALAAFGRQDAGWVLQVGPGAVLGTIGWGLLLRGSAKQMETVAQVFERHVANLRHLPVDDER